MSWTNLTYYRPQTKFAKVMFLHVCVSPRVEHLGRYPWDQVHPPGPGTPLGTRYTPRTRYTLPWDPVHPPGPGTRPWTRYTPWAGTHPWQVHPLGPGTSPRSGTPPSGYTPPGSSACWEIRATSGRYASYWNAFLFSLYIH